MTISRMDVSCVDVFCGAGGLTHGFIREGLRVNAGIDVDPACRYPYSANNDATFVQRDITGMDASEVARLFTPGTVRVLAGCAPCQPFSTYNQRRDPRADQKWGLLYEFVRIIEGVVPDIVTMENVPAIRRHDVFRDFVRTLVGLGYEVWHDVVDCAWYGVPQFRRRVVLLASLYGQIRLIEPCFGERGYRTVRQAIGQLRPIRAGEADPDDKLHVAARLSEKNIARIRASKPGGTWRDWPPHLVSPCHRRGSGCKYPSIYGRMEWDRPAPTITTECYQYGSGRFGHPEQDRAISLREAAILQGFPKTYEFVAPGGSVSFKVMGRLIGNAVPLGLARAIAKSIVRHIEQYGVGRQSAISR